MTSEQPLLDSSADNSLISELLDAVQTPEHQRLVRAYRTPNPLPALEGELANLIREIIADEA